jgi:hypothetical protein
MGRPLKIKKTTTKDIGFNAFNAVEVPVFPNTMAATEFYGVVGGNDTVDTSTYPTVKVRVKIGGNAEADGYIIRQKGTIKYLVSDGTNTGVCVLADLDDGDLTDNTMTITMDEGDSTPVRVSKLTNKWALDYSTPPVRYVANFFDGGSTAIKSGTQGQTVTLGLIENYNS